MFKLSSKEEQKQHELLVKRLEDQVQALEAKLERAETRGDNATEKLVELATRYDKLAQDAAGTAREADERLQQLISAQQRHERELADFLHREQQLRSSLRAEETKFRELEATRTNLLDELAGARLLASELSAELKTAKAEVVRSLEREKGLSEKLEIGLRRDKESAAKLASLERDLGVQSKAAAEKSKLAAEVSAKNKALEALQLEQKELERQQKELTEENELLMLNLHQVQEEIVILHEKAQVIEAERGLLKGRLERIGTRYPNHVDFEHLELRESGGASPELYTVWNVTGLSKRTFYSPNLRFKLFLRQGSPGIAVLSPNGDESKISLVPSMIAKSKLDLADFVSLSATQFAALNSAASLIEFHDNRNWEGLNLPATFNVKVWREIVRELIAQWRALPPVLRYDEVKLKRELVNSDYEHLWLEVQGLEFGNYTSPKFEIRIGAALVQPNGFSVFPKFEFPLIDGKTKPFESWFAESHDDLGAKLELRFSNESKNFDLNVWTKLSAADRVLVANLIVAVPHMLIQLSTKKVAIQREWKTWIDFAKASGSILREYQTKAQATARPAGTAQPIEPLQTRVQLAKHPQVIQVPAPPSKELPKLQPRTTGQPGKLAAGAPKVSESEPLKTRKSVTRPASESPTISAPTMRKPKAVRSPN